MKSYKNCEKLINNLAKETKIWKNSGRNLKETSKKLQKSLARMVIL